MRRRGKRRKQHGCSKYLGPWRGDSDHRRLVYRGLDKVARFLNLLASAGVEPHQAQVKVIIHGAATSLVMNDDAYRDRFGTANPQAKVIEALQGAGVELHVCGQALARQNIPSDAVAPGITIDLSAITTLVLLQQRGWSLVPD